MQEFGEKSDDLMDVFNSCRMFGCAKCGIYKPMWVDYKLYLGMWKDGTNFVADYYSHISHCYRSSSSFASGEIVAERRLKR